MTGPGGTLTGWLRFGPMRRLLPIAAAAASLALAPGAAASPDDGLRDIWTGSWDAELMPG